MILRQCVFESKTNLKIVVDNLERMFHMTESIQLILKVQIPKIKRKWYQKKIRSSYKYKIEMVYNVAI